MQDLSEFIVSFLEYDSQKNIHLILENKKANQKIRIEGSELKYFVYDANKEITTNKELRVFVDMKNIPKIPEKSRIISGQISALIFFQKFCLTRRMLSQLIRYLTV